MHVLKLTSLLLLHPSILNSLPHTFARKLHLFEMVQETTRDNSLQHLSFHLAQRFNLISQEKLLERNYPALPVSISLPHISYLVIYTNTSRPFNLRSRHSASSESNLWRLLQISLQLCHRGMRSELVQSGPRNCRSTSPQACAHCFWLIVEHSYRQQSAGMLALALAVSHVLLCKNKHFYFWARSPHPASGTTRVVASRHG